MRSLSLILIGLFLLTTVVTASDEDIVNFARGYITKCIVDRPQDVIDHGHVYLNNSTLRGEYVLNRGYIFDSESMTNYLEELLNALVEVEKRYPENITRVRGDIFDPNGNMTASGYTTAYPGVGLGFQHEEPGD